MEHLIADNHNSAGKILDPDQTPKIAEQLTGRPAALKGYNGLSIPPEYFLEAMARLRDRYLNVPLSAVLHPASLSAQRAVTEQKAAAEAAPAVQEQELTAQQWFERGFAATDRDEQIRFYTEAIRLKPDYATAYNNRGTIGFRAEPVSQSSNAGSLYPSATAKSC